MKNLSSFPRLHAISNLWDCPLWRMKEDTVFFKLLTLNTLSLMKAQLTISHRTLIHYIKRGM